MDGFKFKRNTRYMVTKTSVIRSQLKGTGVLCNSCGRNVGERGGKHSIPEKRVFLAKYHFNHSILMKHDEFPHKITADEARTAGYTHAADKV